MLTRATRPALCALLIVPFLTSCGGGGSSSGASTAGGPVNVQDIATNPSEWTGSYSLDSGPAGATGSGTIILEFKNVNGDNVSGDVSFLGDGCVTVAGGGGGTFNGTIDSTNGRTRLLVKLQLGAGATLEGTASQSQIRGSIEARNGPCSSGSQNTTGTWFVNPRT